MREYIPRANAFLQQAATGTKGKSQRSSGPVVELHLSQGRPLPQQGGPDGEDGFHSNVAIAEINQARDECG